LAGIDFGQLLVSFLVLVGSLTVHEAAHAWSAFRLGDPTARMLGRLSLNPAVHVDPIGTVLFPLIALVTGLPVIGWAKPVPVDPRHFRAPRRDFALVALAGPVSNLLLAAGASLLFVPLERLAESGAAVPDLIVRALLLAVLLNVLLAVFNLLPVPPLDGSNVLLGVLPEGPARVIEGLRPYGFLLLYGLMFTGLLGALVRPVQSVILAWLL
jgi:Zn-dependent protease